MTFFFRKDIARVVPLRPEKRWAESVMMGLAPHVGRGRAHERVTAAARAIDQKTSLREQLLSDVEIMSLLTPDEVDSLLEPANYLGSAPAMIDAVLARYEATRNSA